MASQVTIYFPVIIACILVYLLFILNISLQISFSIANVSIYYHSPTSLLLWPKLFYVQQKLIPSHLSMEPDSPSQTPLASLDAANGFGNLIPATSIPG